MKSESIAFGIAGILFGLVAGWIIGSQQTAVRSTSQAPPQTAAAAPTGSTSARAAVIDQAQVNALTAVANREPQNPKPRVELGNLYFDGERYDEAIKWYTEA